MTNQESFDIQQFLSQQYSFAQLSQQLIKLAANSIIISYHRQDEQLVLQDRLYLVRSGAVHLQDKNNNRTDTIAEGESFGPQAVTSRNACQKVTMAEDSLLYQLEAEVIDKLCQLNKAFRRYYRLSICNRVRLALASRADNLSLTTSVSTLLKREAVTIDPEQSIRQAAELMNHKKVSSLLVTRNDKLLGMVTDRDMRRKVIADGIDTATDIGKVMTPDPVCISPDAFIFEAVLTMSRFNIHHLPIATSTEIVGLVTTTDLIKQQRSQPVFLIGEIWKADSPQAMAKTCETTPDLFVNLVEADARAQDVSRILTAISDAVNQRLLELAEAQLGPAPVSYAWLVFGSQAREDQNISSDQDNALLLSNDFRREEHGDYFDKLTKFVCDALNECGYIYCPGNIMASNHQWQLSLDQWRQTFSQWVNKASPQAILNSSIFFDLRQVYGDEALFEQLRQYVITLPKSGIFLGLLAQSCLDRAPPLGFFRNLVVERRGDHKNELDLKKAGSMTITDMVRLYTLSNNLDQINTAKRLQQLSDKEILNHKDARNLIDAIELINSIRLTHQAQELRQGKKPDNFIAPGNLSSLQRNNLKDSFSIIKDQQDAINLAFPSRSGS